MAITYPAPVYQGIDTSITQEQPLLVPNPETQILGASSNRELSTPANSIVIGSGSPRL